MQQKTGLRPALKEVKVSGQPEAAPGEPEENRDGLFSGEMKAQLEAVFARMAKPLVLRLYLDDRPVSEELKQYMTGLAALTEKLSVEVADEPLAEAPCVRILRQDGTDTGLAFHGVPGGHEFTSFVLGLYNAAGPGQALGEETAARIQSIGEPVDMKILVSLSCTMCPELVTAAQKIAAENQNVRAEVYDLNHFAELKDRYNVMSVPCLVVGDTKVSFGKKNIEQLLDFIQG